MNNHNLRDILTRIEKAAEILDLEHFILDKLSGFKYVWQCDVEARMDDGSFRQFRAVRVGHRSPHTDQPHKGGMRYHPDVDAEMMKPHSIEMSMKCWLEGIAWGGAKGGVAIDPYKFSQQELKNITEAWVDEMDERNILGPFRDVPAPDVGTTPKIMNWVRQRYAQRRRSREDARFAGVVTGKPVGYGFDGIPGRNEATGYGLVAVMRHVLMNHLGKKDGRPSWKDVVVMGFGNVGAHAARFAKESGYRVIAVSDVNGGIYNPHGLDIGALTDYANVKRTVFGAPYGDKITNEELLRVPCDILIPAALENVITTENVNDIRAKMIVEGANGPTTPEADEILQENGIVVVPDILANAGGVTVSFFEWARNVNIRDERVPIAQKEAVLKAMSGMLMDATNNVFETAGKYQASLRHAAYIAAIDRAAPLFKAKHIA